jgi:hypothetical protein
MAQEFAVWGGGAHHPLRDLRAVPSAPSLYGATFETVVPMVPNWLPLGGAFWAALTGIAFELAGLAIISGVLEILAARLLGAMLLVFSALALAPLIFASPRDHVSWGANAYNLSAVGAAWIIAEWLADRQQSVQHQEDTQLTRPSSA